MVKSLDQGNDTTNKLKVCYLIAMFKKNFVILFN